ncbi:very short patch repair endonuclease [Microvirga sesbaniae]|uniref:very short patch repair endonuclease n=1 Tax=Microvirga sesbaniae TaxID=681392 RepID=UPI0021CAD2F2|nr:DNA mismatch endonuclease Vsr [Microvirga sp. HBU67692]
MDIVEKAKRSAMMARIRSKDTQPELRVRRIAHAMGYRYRLHRRDLPGSPDLVFPRLRKVILIHGCYWHRHPGCRFAYQPKSNTAFWDEKFRRNQERDRRVLSELRALGWDPLIIWECETRNPETLRTRIAAHLEYAGDNEQ